VRGCGRPRRDCGRAGVEAGAVYNWFLIVVEIAQLTARWGSGPRRLMRPNRWTTWRLTLTAQLGPEPSVAVGPKIYGLKPWADWAG
jgi:hypothetical protein